MEDEGRAETKANTDPKKGVTFRIKENGDMVSAQTPKSKAQKIFKSEIEKAEAKAKKINQEIGYPDNDTGYELYAFHDDKSVAVDGMLYDVLKDGQGEFGIGKDFYQSLLNALEKAGYYLENEGMGVYIFVSGS